ncbi:MAG: PAS domain S-box protein [Spirochaetes bacterium]|nr:PAS domain S-box protein [Spirochaetota bacterium]
MSEPAKTILLVEDESIIAMDEAVQLEREGFRVTTVSSGQAAIDAVRKSAKSIDFILMDIDLGRGMDGTEAAQEILRDHDIPLMFLSSHTEREIVDRTEKITTYGYMVKSSGITVLAASIRMAFRLHEANRRILEQKLEIEAASEEMQAASEEMQAASEEMQAANEEMQAANEEMQAANEELEAANEELMNYQEELQASERRYHGLFEAMNDGVSLHDLICDEAGTPVDYRIVDVNRRYTEITGVGRDAAVGHLSSEAYGTADPPFLKEFSEVALTGRPATVEVYYEPMKKHFLISMFSPGPKKFACVFQDITEKRRIEAELRQSEQRYASILEGSAEGILIAHQETRRFVYANPAICSMLGYDEGELLGLSVRDIHPPKRLQFVVEQFAALTRGDIQQAVSIPCLRKDGSVFYADIVSSGIVIDGALCNAGFFTDITERKLAQEAVLRERDFNRNALDSLPGLFYLFDEEGRFLRWNRNFSAVSGYDDGEIAAMAPLDFFPEEERGLIAQRIRRVYKEGEITVEARFRCRDGRLIPMLFSGTSLAYEGKNCVVGMGIDISQRKTAEADLENILAILEGAFEQIPIPMVLCTMPGAIMRIANSASRTYLGVHDEADPTGTSLMDYSYTWKDYYPDGREIPFPELPLARALNGEFTRNLEYYTVTKHGDLRWGIITAAPVYNRAGELIAAFVIFPDITDKKAAEQQRELALAALRESEERWQFALEGSGDGVWDWNVRTKEVFFSRRWKEMLGYGDDEIYNNLSEWDTRVHPEDRERCYEDLERHFRGEAPYYENRHRLRCKDGSYRWILDRGKVISRGNDGSPLRVIGTHSDITESVAEHAALENALALLEGAFQQSPVPMVMCTMPGAVIRFTNTASRRILGIMDEPSPLGLPLMEYQRTYTDCYPDGREIPAEELPLMMALKGRFTHNMEYQIVTKTGETRWAMVSGSPIYNRAGELIAALIVFPDITDLKNAEVQRGLAVAALRESEERFRLLAENSTDMISRHAPDGSYLYASPASRVLLGYEPEELAGRSAFDFVHPDDQAYLERKRSTVTGGGDVTISTFRVIRKDGSTVWFESNSRSVRDERTGEITEIHVSSRDITERKRAEEALESRLVALTRPLDDAGSLAFEDLFNIQSIQEIQDHFARATGVAVLMTSVDGTPITSPSNFCRLCAGIIRKTEQGRINCQHSDAELGRYHPEGPIIQQCLSGGFWGGGASISVGGRHIANWLIGQVRNEAQNEEAMRSYAREIGADEGEVLEAFREVPTMPRERFEEVARMLFVIANHLSLMAFQNVQQARFITERKSAEAALEKLVMEKEVLLKELQHRVKNSLSIVSSLLGLEVKNLHDERSRTIFTNTRSRINSMSAVYEQLYRAGGLNRVDLGQYAGDLAASLQSTYMPESGNVAIEKMLQELWLDVKSVVPLGLIMNELISNALKYAGIRDRRVTIRVIVRNDGDTGELSVEDDGAGLPAGFDLEETQSMGFLLVRMLTQQIQGTLEVKSTPGAGTAVTVRFGI